MRTENMIDLQRADPIFIHGILPRSGTNFLCDLLLLHPDCARARDPVREDLFLDHSDHLVAFADSVQAAWDPMWGSFDGDLPERLYAAIGSGLVSFLWSNREQRLVSKSPSVRHLDRFFKFYPRARLLILVRDGRSVVQSGVDTFGWNFDRACRAWAAAAREISQFRLAEAGRADRWRIMRYEDLLDTTEQQMRSIFEFLDLDPQRYDFEAARRLPVRGSSTFGRRGGRVHWEVVERDASFAPRERWRSWSGRQVDRFEWLAGDELALFGYEAPAITRSVARSLRHTLLDWRSIAAQRARWTIHRTRVRVGTASRPLRRRLGLLREA